MAAQSDRLKETQPINRQGRILHNMCSVDFFLSLVICYKGWYITSGINARGLIWTPNVSVLPYVLDILHRSTP